ncbi:MAG: NUDIX hydrolase [Candidatus Glassbacteria bacterium]|nr:NUDIX hydrolase [Candidatus Glassbacteria bacterium]
MSGKAKKVSGRKVLEGKLLTVEVDQVVEPGASGPARREVVRHSGAAAVIPCLPGGRIVLVRQYRYAPDAFLWEVPAGVLEKGESPEDCARRELAEETGFQAGSLSLLVRLLSSPGFSDEVIHLYRADRLIHGEADPEPSEKLEIGQFDIFEALRMVAAGTITDAKTIIAVLLAAREICPSACSGPGL